MLTRVIVTVFAVGAASAAIADDSGFYAGLGAGTAHNSTGELSVDGHVFKILAGYAFNDYLAIEAAYVDPAEESDFLHLSREDLRVDIDTKGTIVGTVFSLPMHERWSIYGKAGWAFYDVQHTARSGDQRLTVSDSDNDFAWGLGTAVRIGERWSVRVEYEEVDVSRAFNTVMLSGAVRF